MAKTNRQGKPNFDDKVRFVLIAGIVICVAVLGAGGYFAARSFFGGDFNPPPASALDSGEETFEPAEEPSGDSGEEQPEEPAVSEQTKEPEQPSGQAEEPGGRPVETAKTPGAVRLPAERKGILVFVIDDAGNNLADLDPFLAFPAPLTIAVLPGLPYSAEAARRIRAAKKEVFLHQPMESLGGQNPGPGAVTTGMSGQEIRSIINQNLDGIWPVAGMNNHEGSKATMDSALVNTVLELCRERRIHFLDSKTIADSVIPAAAKNLGLSILQRDIFLDNEQDRESIIKSIEEGCKRAERNGFAVMIGHVWSPKLAGILTEIYPSLVKQGFFFAAASSILNAGK